MSGSHLEVSEELVGEIAVSAQPIHELDESICIVEILGHHPFFPAEQVFTELEKPEHFQFLISWTRRALHTTFKILSSMIPESEKLPQVAINFPLSLLGVEGGATALLREAIAHTRFLLTDIVIEITERDLAELQKPEIQDKLKQLIAASEVTVAIDDIDSKDSTNPVLQMRQDIAIVRLALKEKTTCILKVNGKVIDALSDGNMELAIAILELAQQMCCSAIVFEKVENNKVIDLLKLLQHSKSSDIQILVQGFALSPKQPISEIDRHFVQP